MQEEWDRKLAEEWQYLSLFNRRPLQNYRRFYGNPEEFPLAVGNEWDDGQTDPEPIPFLFLRNDEHRVLGNLSERTSSNIYRSGQEGDGYQ